MHSGSLQFGSFFPGQLAIPRTKYDHMYLQCSPLEYASLCDWVYEDKKPPFGELLKSYSKEDIRYALIEHKGLRICVIRGTANKENAWLDAKILMDGGKLKEEVEKSVREVIKKFTEEFGALHVVTGHSLGGRLAEIVVQDKGILGVTFNSYLANQSDSIIAFRVHGDISQAHKGHTDRHLGKAGLDGIFLQPLSGGYAHRIDCVIKCLNKASNFWVTSDYFIAKNAAPDHFSAKVANSIAPIEVQDEQKPAAKDPYVKPRDKQKSLVTLPGVLQIGF